MRVGGRRTTPAPAGTTPCSPVFVTGEAAALLLLAAKFRRKSPADYLDWLIRQDAKRLTKLGTGAREAPGDMALATCLRSPVEAKP